MRQTVSAAAEARPLCLRHARHVTSDLIGALKVLRNRLLRPAIVSGIGTAERATHVEALVNHICQSAPTLPDHVIAQSLETGGLADLFRWASRMILRHGVGLAGGLADCEAFSFLRTGEHFKLAATRHQNCLADETQGWALAASFGVSAVAEWRHGSVLAVLTLMSDGGDLRDLHDIITTLTRKGATVTFQSERLSFSPKTDDPFATLHLHLLGAVAQFERALIKRRQAEGIAKAKERGVYRGRKPVIDHDRIRDLHAAGERPTAIARAMGISRITVYRALDAAQQAAA